MVRPRRGRQVLCKGCGRLQVVASNRKYCPRCKAKLPTYTE